MKNKKILLKAIVLLGLAIAAFLWGCALTAFVWAGWGGFGGISKEYTAEGTFVSFVVLCIPPIILLILLFMHVRRIRIKKDKEGLRYLFLLIAAVAAGIIFSYIVPSLSQPIIKNIQYIITMHPDWMEYPIP